MLTDESHEIHSNLSSRLTVGGICVNVQIFRLDFYHLWALEVVTERGGSLVWDELFETDEEALAAFEAGAEELGVAGFLSNAHWEICRSASQQSIFAASLEDCSAEAPERFSVRQKLSAEQSGTECLVVGYERG
jgi:hypothetical protein